MRVLPGSRSGGGADAKPQTVEWRAIGEGVMMVSILHEGRLYKGALTVQVSATLLSTSAFYDGTDNCCS